MPLNWADSDRNAPCHASVGKDAIFLDWIRNWKDCSERDHSNIMEKLFWKPYRKTGLWNRPCWYYSWCNMCANSTSYSSKDKWSNRCKRKSSCTNEWWHSLSISIQSHFSSLCCLASSESQQFSCSAAESHNIRDLQRLWRPNYILKPKWSDFQIACHLDYLYHFYHK